MDAGLVSSLSGALAQSKRVEIIANNLANADTTAFKGDDLAFEETLQGAQHPDMRSDIPEKPFKESEFMSQAGKEHRAVLYGSEFTDLKAGSFRQTSNRLDIAIEGNGFLEVLTPQGIRLTRAGSLALDPGGRLITPDGFLVLGPGAAPPPGAPETAALRAITIGSNAVQIDIEGNIYGSNNRGNQVLGKLSLVQVENPKELKKEGRGLFEASPDAVVRPVGGAAARAPASEIEMKENPLGPTGVAPKVHQGMLESSNVNPVIEMTKLIDAHRLFDQNTRMMQSVGEMNSRVSEIGKF